MSAERALGTTLKVASTTVGGLTSIGGIDLTAETMDVTALDSTGGYREHVPTFVDGGEVSAEGYLQNKGADGVILVDLVGSDTVSACEIEFPSGAKWAFNAFVVGFGTNAELEGAVEFSLTLKVSGKPTFTAGSGS